MQLPLIGFIMKQAATTIQTVTARTTLQNASFLSFIIDFTLSFTPTSPKVRGQTEIYLSVSINIALHGEPSAPDKFSGAAFKK